MTEKSMRKCFTCEGDLPDGAAFCPHCGRQIKKSDKGSKDKNETGESGGRPRKEGPKESRAYTEGLPLYRANREKDNEAIASTNRTIIWIMAGIGVIAAGFSAVTLNFGVFLAALFLIFLISIVGLKRKDRIISRYEYYQLPGASEGPDGHTCIFCGAHRIFKKGEYKSSVVYSHCTKCGNILFSE